MSIIIVLVFVAVCIIGAYIAIRREKRKALLWPPVCNPHDYPVKRPEVSDPDQRPIVVEGVMPDGAVEAGLNLPPGGRLDADGTIDYGSEVV